MKMHKDIKIGLVLGLVLVIIVVIRISTDPRLSPEARIEQLQETIPQDNSISEKNILNESPPASIQENLSYEKPDENIIAQHESESDIPTSTKPVNELTGNKDVSTIEQNQNELITEVPDSSKFEQTEKIQTLKFHIVQKNETLTGISQKYYGSANKWKKIYEFNRNVIKDPNKINPGTKLIIPNL